MALLTSSICSTASVKKEEAHALYELVKTQSFSQNPEFLHVKANAYHANKAEAILLR